MPNISARKKVFNGYSFSSEARTFFASLTSIPSLRQRILYDKYLFRPLVSAGYYTELDRLWVFASEIQANGLVSLVNPTSTAITEVNSPTWTQFQGFDFNGTTQYLNTNVAVNALTKFTQNSASNFLYVRENTTTTGADFGGYSGGGTNNTSIFLRDATNTCYAAINDGGAGSNGTVTDSRGGFMFQRTASNAKQSYKNGVSFFSDTEASTTITTANNFIGARSNSGVAIDFCNRQISIVAIGSGSINALTFYNIIQGYMTQLGSQV